jgi:hypothetical protein
VTGEIPQCTVGLELLVVEELVDRAVVWESGILLVIGTNIPRGSFGHDRSFRIAERSANYLGLCVASVFAFILVFGLASTSTLAMGEGSSAIPGIRLASPPRS